jgi:hypothetical protein
MPDLIGTYTILNAYRNCPHQMYRRYIAKDLGAFVETPEMQWGTRVHKAFEQRIAGKKPLPTDMQQWENFAVAFDAHHVLVEQQLGITKTGEPVDYWDKTKCWFRGKADAAVLRHDTAFMCDWKTGSSKYENDFELRTGALLLKAAHPALKVVRGAYAWLKENRMGEVYDLSDTQATFREVSDLMAEIALGRWEKRKSGLCGWCNVTDCENWRERK